MKQLLLLTLLFVANTAFSQKDCDCNKALDKLITKIENEYPGFEEKTADKFLYDSFKKQLKEEASATEQSFCFEVLKKFTSFFKDGHIYFLKANSSIENVVDATTYIDVDMVKFMEDSKTKTNSLEGVWVYSSIDVEEVDFKVGIIQTKKEEYTGFAIPSSLENSASKRVLFKLTSKDKYESYFPNKTKHTGDFKVQGNAFLYFKTIERILIKEEEAMKFSEEDLERKYREIQGFKVKQLTDRTVSITLPSFDYPFVETINNLIEENRNLIENSENLILDVRGNGGGTGNAFQELLPYIMTNPIRDMWIEFLATETLIDGLESYIESIKEEKESQEEIKEIKEEIILFKKNLGKFVNTEENSFTIQEVAFAKKSPKYVVILIDKGVASSGEDFVIAAKQSKKVKILGTPTYGAIDYASVRPFDFGCPDYNLYLPTFRSLRLPEYPIDNIGIQPDIYLDQTVTDWVQFAIDYLEY